MAPGPCFEWIVVFFTASFRCFEAGREMDATIWGCLGCSIIWTSHMNRGCLDIQLLSLLHPGTASSSTLVHPIRGSIGSWMIYPVTSQLVYKIQRTRNFSYTQFRSEFRRMTCPFSMDLAFCHRCLFKWLCGITFRVPYGVSSSYSRRFPMKLSYFGWWYTPAHFKTHTRLYYGDMTNHISIMVHCDFLMCS